jgi:hypothetical protein
MPEEILSFAVQFRMLPRMAMLNGRTESPIEIKPLIRK